MGAISQHLERSRTAGARPLQSSQRGVGFVQWEKADDYLKGILRNVWHVPDKDGTQRDIALMEVVEIEATVTTKTPNGLREEVFVAEGDLVNVSMGTAQLRGVTAKMNEDEIYLIHYKGTEETKRGNTLKLFDVYPEEGDLGEEAA